MTSHCHLVITFTTWLLIHSFVSSALSDAVFSDYISEKQGQNAVWKNIPPLAQGIHPS